MGTWFKFQFLMFIFPQIVAAALFRGWEYPLVVLGAGIPQGTGGKWEVMLHHLFLGFWGDFSPLLLPPSPWMLDLGGDGKPPDLLPGLVSCGRRERQKAENL